MLAPEPAGQPESCLAICKTSSAVLASAQYLPQEWDSRVLCRHSADPNFATRYSVLCLERAALSPESGWLGRVRRIHVCAHEFSTRLGDVDVIFGSGPVTANLMNTLVPVTLFLCCASPLSCRYFAALTTAP